MRVTGLKKQGKYKIEVELDGEYAFFLYTKDIRRLGLEEGDEISGQLAEEICRLIVFPRAKEKALSLLQYRSRTRLELRQKLLQAGYPESVADPVMAFLDEYHLLDDAKYVQSYIELHGRKKSRLQMQHELSQKGIDRELFARVWEMQEEDMEEQALREQVEKRIRMKGDICEANYAKFYAYFARKGYSAGMICRLLKEYQSAAE